MKKAAAILFGTVCLVAVLVILAVSIANLRQERLFETPPLTVEEVERLARVVKPEPAVQAVHETDGAEEAPSAKNLPRRLNQAATDAQRAAIYMEDRSARTRVAARVLAGPLGSFVDTLALAAGKREGFSLDLGFLHLARGNWAEARRYYWEFVRNWEGHPGQLREAFAHLSWLEDNPERAARYMELAVSGNEIYPARLSLHLAKQTGSQELADHYARLLEQKIELLPKDLQEVLRAELRVGP